MTNTEFNRDVHNFFCEYINYKPDAIDNNCLLKKSAIREAASLLIENKIFSSIQDMRSKALADYHLLLPDWVFDGIKENLVSLKIKE